MPESDWERAPVAPTGPVKPFIHEGLSSRTLYFSISAIQSRMAILRPDDLDLDYTRTMMGFLMFRPRPARVAMIGLGGGSLAKFCHRHLPRASITVVEINPHVIALRDAFQVPPDSHRFEVIEGDGARFVAETTGRYDVLLVDAFDVDGMPEALGSARCYGDCFDVLAPDGLMVVNLHAGDAHFPLYLQRIRAAFGGAVLCVEEPDGCNAVVFASRGGPLLAPSSLRCPASVESAGWEQLRPAFSRIAHHLRRFGQD